MELSFHEVVLFVHIAAAALLVGTSFVTPALGRRIVAAPTRVELLARLDSIRLVTRANPPVAIVLLASGVWLGSQGWWSEGWFAVSVVAWVMSAALAGGVIKPAAARIAAAAASDPAAPIDAGLDRLRQARAWCLAERALIASDVAILWIMVAKPELAESIATLAGATVVLVAGGAVVKPAPRTA